MKQQPQLKVTQALTWPDQPEHAGTVLEHRTPATLASPPFQRPGSSYLTAFAHVFPLLGQFPSNPLCDTKSYSS